MATTVVKTIRASGGDYTTLSAWEAAQQGDLVTADEVRVAECYDDWATGLNDAVTIDGSTTDATRYMKITVAAGHRHTGIPQTGFFIKKAAGYVGLIINSDTGTVLEWLDVENPDANGTAFRPTIAPIMYHCIAKAGRDGFGVLTNGTTVFGCLAYSCGTGFYCSGFNSPKIYNCVAANCTTGFNLETGSGDDVRNSVAYNCTTNWAGSFSASCTNNASSSASDDAPGASSVWNVASTDFVNAAGNDFHLASGSALIGAGTNLYSTYTTDMDGDAWPSSGAWDIGFDYYVAAGGAITGTLAVTESGTDTAAAAGDVYVAGALAATESGADTAAFTGDASSTTTGTLAATESGSDTAAATGDVYVSGALATTESGADTAAITGDASNNVIGTLAATESGSDTAAGTGDVYVNGALSAGEAGSDTAAVTGDVYVQGAIVVTEEGVDTTSFSGTAAGPRVGALAATESGQDTALFIYVPPVESRAHGGGGRRKEIARRPLTVSEVNARHEYVELLRRNQEQRKVEPAPPADSTPQRRYAPVDAASGLGPEVKTTPVQKSKVKPARLLAAQTAMAEAGTERLLAQRAEEELILMMLAQII